MCVRCRGSQDWVRGDFNTGHVFAVASEFLTLRYVWMHPPVIYDYPEKSSACWPERQNYFGGAWGLFCRDWNRGKKSPRVLRQCCPILHLQRSQIIVYHFLHKQQHKNLQRIGKNTGRAGERNKLHKKDHFTPWYLSLKAGKFKENRGGCSRTELPTEPKN